MSVGKITAFGAILCSTVWVQCALAQDALPPGAAAPPPDASAPPPPGAGAPPPAIIGSNVNLRQGPGTTYPVITLLPAGSPVNVGGCKGGWCQISYQGQNGYIMAVLRPATSRHRRPTITATTVRITDLITAAPMGGAAIITGTGEDANCSAQDCCSDFLTTEMNRRA
jgi:hypothetical protein